MDVILYTAPAHVFASTIDSVSYSIADQNNDTTATGSASVQLDRGVVVTPLGKVTVAKGQSAVVDRITAGLPGDTVTLVQTSAGLGIFTLVEIVNGGTTQPNQYEVIYIETGDFTTSQRSMASFQVFDGIGGKPAGDTPYIRLDAGPKVTATRPGVVVQGQSTVIGTVIPGFAGDVETLSQTDPSQGTLALAGNKIIYTAAANVTATALNTVSYTITDQLGSSVAASATIKVLGAPPLDTNATIAPKTGGNFFDLVGGAPAMTFVNANSVVLVEGMASPTITDNSIGLKIDVGSDNVAITIKNFAADVSATVDLLYGVGGYTSAAAAQAALTPDGNGGALLGLPGGSGSIDFVGVAPDSIAATHFRIG